MGDKAEEEEEEDIPGTDDCAPYCKISFYFVDYD